jgi:small multidrug resistance pump
MGYLFLLATVCFEVTGTTMMKLSNGFAKPAFSVAALIAYAGTICFMTLSLKRLDLSLVYATWSGMGISLVSILGFALFHEPFQPMKLIWIALIAIGVVGLNLMRAA